MALHRMNFKAMEKYLDWWYDFSMANPKDTWCPMMISQPGIGKTTLVENLAAKKGVNLKVLILSQANPTEVAGMTMPSPDGRHETYIYDPSWVRELKDGDILFLDEVLKAPQAVLNSCLTMIQSRIMASGTKLPNIAIISAANESKTAQNYPDELKQRFVEVELVYDVIVYAKYMKQKFPELTINTTTEEKFDRIASRYLPVGCAQGWNRFTPRDCTKMIAATLSCKSVQDFRDNLYDPIGCMYGLSIRDELGDLIEARFLKPKLTKRQELEEFLINTGDHSLIQMVEEGKELDDVDFVYNLSQNSFWEELQGLLAEVSVSEEAIPY